MNDYIQRAQRIRLLVLDVDGVLTDGRITYTSGGEEIKAFDVQDGHGIRMAIRGGLTVAIISARGSPTIDRLTRDLGITDVYVNQLAKEPAYRDLKAKYGLADEEVAYIGDDLMDVPIIRRAGLSVAVPNAVDEVKQYAVYHTRRHGGRGAVREVIELVLKGQNKWGALMQRYLSSEDR